MICSFQPERSITKAQYDKSYGDMVVKMGMKEVAKEIEEKSKPEE